MKEIKLKRQNEIFHYEEEKKNRRQSSSSHGKFKFDLLVSFIESLNTEVRRDELHKCRKYENLLFKFTLEMCRNQ